MSHQPRPQIRQRLLEDAFQFVRTTIRLPDAFISKMTPHGDLIRVVRERLAA